MKKKIYMKIQDRKLLTNLLTRGKMDDEIIQFMQQNMRDNVKKQIENMGNKWCLHSDNSPKKVK